MNIKNKILTHKSVWITVILFGLCILFIKAAFDEIVGDKNRQIDIFQREIDESRNILKNNSAEGQTLNTTIDSLSSNLKALQDFLKDYQNQNFLSPEEIAIETNMVLFLEDEVDKIQQSFKSKIINLYKHGKNYELELLLSSKTPNEFMRRNQYLQKFAQSRKKELKDLKAKKFMLEEKKKLLSLSVSSQRYYIESKRSEKTQIEERLKQLNARKSVIENENTLGETKIDLKEEQINRVKDFLAGFNNNKQNYKGAKTNRLTYSTDQFDKLKGNLNLPVDFALIQNEFGDYENAATGTKWNNSGIDFSISKGSKVYAVAGGTVSLIGEVPYYGKVIIINHENGYRTVYSSLSEVNVNTGDKVKLNQIIAKTGETLEGQILHFELWLNGTAMNPKEWLRL